ncbi:Zinc finger, PMZ-type [Sesbania bispinosa]|nr:Zinc finger, PMZ-type [Sesbania bispinosa]
MAQVGKGWRRRRMWGADVTTLRWWCGTGAVGEVGSSRWVDQLECFETAEAVRRCGLGMVMAPVGGGSCDLGTGMGVILVTEKKLRLKSKGRVRSKLGRQRFHMKEVEGWWCQLRVNQIWGIFHPYSSFAEDESGIVYVVEDNTYEKTVVVDEEAGDTGSVEDGNGDFPYSQNNDNSDGVFFCDDEYGGAFLVEPHWDEKNAEGEGDGDVCVGEKIVINTADDILNMGDLCFFNPPEIEKGRTLKSRKSLVEYQKEMLCSRSGVREDRGLRMEDRVCEPRADTRKKDLYNKITEQRRKLCSDAKAAVQYLGELRLNDGMMYFEHTMDSDGRLQHLFWADGISQNAGFTKGFEDYMFRYYDVGTFRNKWNELVSKYGVQDHPWVNALYEKRTMWATAHLRGKFFGGFRTTSRCEGLHSELAKFVNSRRVLNKASMLVVRNYTQAVRCMIFRVSGQVDRPFECRVSLYVSTKEFKCSCLKMESRGLPCEHIVVVLAHMGVDDIQDSLILKRWTKGAKDGLDSLIGNGNNFIDAAWSVRRASLAGLYDHVSGFKSRTIEKYNLERDRLLADLRECKAEIEADQGTSIVLSEVGQDSLRNPVRVATKGSAVASTSSGLRVRRKQICSLWKLPGHNKLTCPRRGHHVQLNQGASSDGPSESVAPDIPYGDYEEFDPDSWAFA